MGVGPVIGVGLPVVRFVAGVPPTVPGSAGLIQVGQLVFVHANLVQIVSDFGVQFAS
jgi:hypothetical protein